MADWIQANKNIVELMIDLYCRHNHPVFLDGNKLCDDCLQLQKYSMLKLDKCPFGQSKPACVSCNIHCYSPEEKKRIRTVMRYACPRMIYKHPAATVKYLYHKLQRQI